MSNIDTIQIDVVIVGAGAGGLMCAIEAGKRGRSVVVIEHSKKLGEKIRISGGGKCNFTNMYIEPKSYICQNPHFMKSALKQYSQWDFIDMINRHKIPYFEKDLGQLFCDNSACDIIDMLRNECDDAGVKILMETSVRDIKKSDFNTKFQGDPITNEEKTVDGEEELSDIFTVETTAGIFTASSLVVASGGFSVPKIGATGFGYDVADFFEVPVLDTYPALVPLTFDQETVESMAELSGVSVDALVTANGVSFREGLLFTHRGLSGPSILQISSYVNEGDSVAINILPDLDVFEYLKQQKIDNPKKNVDVVLKKHLPNRLVDMIMDDCEMKSTLADASHNMLELVAHTIEDWTICPNGTEGYRTAEVTRGGVDTNAVSSKTMECDRVAGLYFVGEVLDVTGWLGGYNFQWAWSSGFVAGQHC